MSVRQLFHLRSQGIAHLVVPIVMMVGIAIVGTYLIVASHAQTPVPLDTSITSKSLGTTANTTASFSFTSSYLPCPKGATCPVNIKAPRVSFSCQLDGGASKPCASPMNYADLGAGVHSFSVRAADSNGSVDETPATQSWAIQLAAAVPPATSPASTATPIDTTITSKPLGTTANTTASFTFEHTYLPCPKGTVCRVNIKAPTVSFSCQLDGGASKACASPMNYNDLSAGMHSFSVRATDSDGSTDDTPAIQSWTITASKPGTFN